jgi:hypothetical protein
MSGLATKVVRDFCAELGLAQNHREFLTEFQRIVETSSLDT